MNQKVIRIAMNEAEERALRIEAEKACRRPEQQARWLLRQVLGLTNDPSMQVSEQTQNGIGRARQDTMTNAVL